MALGASVDRKSIGATVGTTSFVHYLFNAPQRRQLLKINKIINGWEGERLKPYLLLRLARLKPMP
jgi:hypothetical protein